MSMFRKSLRVCRAEFISWRKDYRIYLVFFLLLNFVLMYTDDLFAYSAQLNYPITPWLLPLQMMGINNRMIVYGCAVLYFSNIFRSRSADQAILIRCGYKAVLLGKLLYILLAALIYGVLFEVFTILPRLNQIYFSWDWGRFLWEYSGNRAVSAGRHIPGSLYILNSGRGWSMTLWSFLHLWLSLVLVGLLMFILNSGGGFLQGTVATGVLLGIDKATTGLIYAPLCFVPWVSPLTWSNAYLVDFGVVETDEMLFTIPVWYADAASILLNAALIALLCLLTYLSYRRGSRRQWIHLS